MNNAEKYHTVNGIPVEQRMSNGFIDATAMCKAQNRQLRHWFSELTTLDLVQALASNLGLNTQSQNSNFATIYHFSKAYPELINIYRNSRHEASHIWLHPDLAIQLARWCSFEFAAQVYDWVKEWKDETLEPAQEPITESENTVIEKVKPQIVNGIEFYVSADGSVAGCSRPGVAALCGVTRQSLSEFIDNKGAGKNVSKSLKALLDKPFYLQVIGTNGARILTEELCIAIIEYYAFHSPSKNDVAQFSFRKFAAMGWRKWVLEVTGYRPTSDEPQANSAALFGAVMEELKQLRGDVQELTNVKRIAGDSHPGLGSLVEGYGKAIIDVPKGLPNPFTYNQWAMVTGSDRRSDSDKRSMQRRVAEMVKSLRRVRQVEKKYSQNKYHYSDLPAFEATVKEFV